MTTAQDLRKESDAMTITDEMVERAARALCSLNNPYEKDNSWQRYIDDARAALEAAMLNSWRPKWRHKKRGSEYDVIGVGNLQTGLLVGDDTAVIIYRGHDGRLWVRPRDEFHDGRFEPLHAPPSEDKT